MNAGRAGIRRKSSHSVFAERTFKWFGNAILIAHPELSIVTWTEPCAEMAAPFPAAFPVNLPFEKTDPSAAAHSRIPPPVSLLATQPFANVDAPKISPGGRTFEEARRGNIAGLNCARIQSCRARQHERITANIDFCTVRNVPTKYDGGGTIRITAARC